MAKRNVVWALVFILPAAGFAAAQETTGGSLAGHVTDAQGGAVPGATVTVKSPQGIKTFVTDTGGRFFAPYLTPGIYAVAVGLSGFSTGRAEEHPGPPGHAHRAELRPQGERRPGSGGSRGRRSHRRHHLHHRGRHPRRRHAQEAAGGPQLHRHALPDPGRQRFELRGPRQPLDRRGERTREQLHHRRREREQHRVRGHGLLLAPVPVAGHGRDLRVHQGDPGQDRRLRGRVRPGHGRRRERRHPVRHERVPRGRARLLARGLGRERLEAARDPERHGQHPGNEPRRLRRLPGRTARQGPPLLLRDVQPHVRVRSRARRLRTSRSRARSYDRKRKSYSYAGKLTWQASANHRFEASLYGDPSEAELGPQRNSALLADSTTRFSSLDYGGHNQSFKYDGIISPNWLIEAAVGHSSNKVAETPASDTYSVTDRTVVPNARSGGIGFYEDDNGNNYQASFKSTNLFNAEGRHQLRYGVIYENIDYFQGTKRTGPSFTLSDGQQTASGASMDIIADPVRGRIYRVTRADLSPGRDTTQKYLSLFAQDTWTIGRKLTFRPGIRWDRQELEGSEEFPACLRGHRAHGRGRRRALPSPATTPGATTSRPASARPTTSRVTAGPRSSPPTAAST